jgi:type IV pilus assembly protein PilV
MLTPLPRRRGIALMEAMIAILLLSVSALAYAALQLRGLSASGSALWRSKATMLAYEMTDRMRANHIGVENGNYNSLTVPTTVTDCGSGSACSPARMAQLDYSQWSTALGQALPGGSGVVCLDSSPDDGKAGATACDGSGGMLVIKVFWSERGQLSRLVIPVRP